MRNLNILLEE